MLPMARCCYLLPTISGNATSGCYRRLATLLPTSRQCYRWCYVRCCILPRCYNNTNVLLQYDKDFCYQSFVILLQYDKDFTTRPASMSLACNNNTIYFCYNGLIVLLQLQLFLLTMVFTARGVATDGGHCFRRADDATEMRCCYRQHAAMLPMAYVVATDDLTMLPTVFDKAMSGCYRRIVALVSTSPRCYSDVWYYDG